MTISADLLRHHIEYNVWATNRLLHAAADLPAEELTRDFGTADRSIFDTLGHVFGAERIWLARIKEGSPAGPLVKPAATEIPQLSVEWSELHGRWREWMSSLTDEDAMQVIHYTDLKNRPWSNPLWQILLHVVNHSTHHRGQASGFIRALGKVPPPLDFIAFVRENAAKSTAQTQ